MFQNKLVAVMNEKIDHGVIMNALAHACIGLGAKIGEEDLRLCTYVDADGTNHPAISEMPFIILKANSNKIRKLRSSAIEAKLKFADFTHTMTGGGYEEQLEWTSKMGEEKLIYYGIVLFGPWDEVTELTRKFSLWK